MNIHKKISDFIKSIGNKSLDQYLTENNDKYIKEIENISKINQQIENIFRISQNNSDKLYKVGHENLKNWRYFNDYKREFFLLGSDFSTIIQIKEVDKFKDTTIFVGKYIDIKTNELKESIKSNSGYIWQSIDDLVFNTFNNYPKILISVLNDTIILDIFGYDIKKQVDENQDDMQEFKKHIKWMKEQLEIITNHPFKSFIEYKKSKIDNPITTGVSVKFVLDYEYI